MMEPTPTNPSPNEGENLELNVNGSSHLRDAGKWSKFIAIVGFVFLAMMVIAGITMALTFSTLPAENMPFDFPGTLIAVFYLFMAAIYFFPLYYLWRFAIASRRALANRSAAELEGAMRYLKSFYQFIGILMIIVLVIYLLAFLAMAAGGVLGGMMAS